jgi:hypothetical protein
VVALQMHMQLRAAALAVGRGDNAIGAAEPGQYVFMAQGVLPKSGEIAAESTAWRGR